MADGAKVQLSFARGEIDPLIGARADSAMHRIGLARAENFIPLPQGVLTRMPGTRYIRDAADQSGLNLLVPFVFSTEQAYALEFSNLKVRVFKDDGIVLGGGGSPVEIVTPYTTAELADLRWTQTADTLWLFHPAHPTQRLRRTSHTSWTLTQAEFLDGPFLPRNEDQSKTIQASGVGGTVTLTAVGFTFPPGIVGQRIRLDLIDYSLIPQWQGNVEITSPNQRENGGHVYGWVLANGHGTPPKTSVNPPRHTEGTVWDGKDILWVYQHSGFGVVRVLAVTPGGATLSAAVERRLPEEVVVAPTWKFWMPAWSEENGYPSLGGFHERRLLAANTAAEPNKVWVSELNDFSGQKAGVDDDDAFTLELVAEGVNAITGIVSTEVLHLLTTSEEFVAGPQANRAPLTPLGTSVLPHSDEAPPQRPPSRRTAIRYSFRLTASACTG